MVQPGDSLTQWDTGLPLDVLKYIGARSVLVPEDFNLHHQLQKTHVEARLKKIESGSNIEWGLAEVLSKEWVVPLECNGLEGDSPTATDMLSKMSQFQCKEISENRLE